MKIPQVLRAWLEVFALGVASLLVDITGAHIRACPGDYTFKALTLSRRAERLFTEAKRFPHQVHMKLFLAFISMYMTKRKNRISYGAGLVLLLLVPCLHAQQKLSLHQAIEEGLRSPAAQVYQGYADQTSALVQQARLRPNPRLFLQSEDLRPWDNNFSLGDDSESYIYAGQNIELGGKRRKRIDFAKANAGRAETALSSQKQQLAARIANAYWGFAAARAAVDLQQQNAASAADIVRYHQERVSAGAMRGVDLLRVQLEHDRAELDLQTAERVANEARIVLLSELGRNNLAEDVQLSDALTSIDTVAVVPVEVALEQRPDILTAREAVASARADSKLQRANAIPDLDLIAGYKRNVGQNALYTSLQVTLPFSDRNQGEVGRADASVRTAEAALAQIELAARAEIEAARAGYERLRQIVLSSLPPMQSRSSLNLTILDDAYRSGGTDLLRYIDARRLAVEVNLNVLQRQAEYHTSVVRLQLAYGEQP